MSKWLINVKVALKQQNFNEKTGNTDNFLETFADYVGTSKIVLIKKLK